ncbi:electron transfer flavoprotein subunit beta/FixA family protein, partial [Eubacteriales bacterium DFI.9.88]|nr:electron transfer flavoprotein subunit beta/FixA family protein [Eubacteriales bacterium DFI.9.88]
QDLLIECLAMGADEGILISDRAVGGSDTWATSNAIAEAVKKIGDFDLIFAGRQAIDGDTAQVGPQLAEKLGMPQVTYVQKFEIADNKKDIRVERALEDGYEVIDIQTPFMLTAIKELNTPRYMYMKGIIDKEKEIKVWNAKDIE